MTGLRSSVLGPDPLSLDVVASRYVEVFDEAVELSSSMAACHTS